MGIDLGQDGALGDVGDVPLGTSGAEVRARIEDAVRTLLDAGGRPIALGGDHSITYPIVRAVRWFHPRLSILHFDAHPDLYPEFQGDPYSHACPFARIMDEKLADQLVQVGIRTMNATQRTQAERHGVDVIDMRAWVTGRRPALEAPIYISIDLDAFDPAFAPGVGHREPGGLTVREVLTVLQGLPVPIVGADVVEFNPQQDAGGGGGAGGAGGARFIEIGPGQVLAGLLKRIVPQADGGIVSWMTSPGRTVTVSEIGFVLAPIGCTSNRSSVLLPIRSGRTIRIRDVSPDTIPIRMRSPLVRTMNTSMSAKF